MAAARKADGKTGPELVAEAARRAYDDASGDVREAARMLEQAVRMKSPLREALTEPLLAGACWDAIRKQVQETRRNIWNPGHRPLKPVPASPVSKEQASRVVHLATGTLKMFPLPGGKRLGEATREEIAAAADFYARQAGDMAHKARWLQLVGQSIPAGKTAGECLTDERLAELQKEAARA